MFSANVRLIGPSTRFEVLRCVEGLKRELGSEEQVGYAAVKPVFDFKCIILYPAKYIDTTLRFKELPLSSCRIKDITSLSELELLHTALESIDKELLASRTIVTGSPGLRCISLIHLLGKDNMYVDLPVNCILRTSFSLGTVLNNDLEIWFNIHIMIINHIPLYIVQYS